MCPPCTQKGCILSCTLYLPHVCRWKIESLVKEYRNASLAGSDLNNYDNYYCHQNIPDNKVRTIIKYISWFCLFTLALSCATETSEQVLIFWLVCNKWHMETLPSHSGLYKIVKEEHNVEALKTIWHCVNMTLALITTCIPVFFTCKTL